MKKIHTLVIALLLTVLLAVPAAAASGKATITPQVLTAAQGETVTLTVELSDAGKIKVGTAVLIYDTAAFELLGGKCLVKDVAVGQVVKDKNAGTFLLMDTKEVSGGIFAFELKVKENASAGDYNIELKTSVGVDKGAYIDAVGATVTVTEKSSGTVVTPTEEKAPDTTTGTTPDTTPDTTPADTQQAPDASVPDVTTPESTEGSVPVDTAVNATDSVADNSESNEEQQGTAEPQGEFSWWILAVVAVAAAAVAVVFLKKKDAK